MNRKTLNQMILGVGLFLVLALFSSCASYRGYGVLVWKNDNLPFPMGELVNISSVFSVDNYYEVDYAGSLVQVPMWQIQFFEKADEARTFQQDFKTVLNSYVFTTKQNGLPIRSTPKTSATVVYKLREGKIAKVLGRDKQRTKIDAFEDYWYWILTEDGYRGYTFGYYLKLIEGSNDLANKVAERIKEDPTLDRFLNNIWRPTKTEKMVETGKIDMEYIQKNFALIPKPSESKITLTNEDMNKEYTYTAIKKLTSDTYEFEGTDLKIQIFPSDKVYVSYFFKDAYVTQEFVIIEKDIEEVAKGESDRRQNVLYGFLNKGKRLTSNTYGSIELGEDYSFAWKNFSALKSIIPQGASGRGTVNFSAYLGALIASQYAGAITFVFREFPERTVTFAYSFSDNGVKLVYVAREFIEDNEIRRVGSSPLVLYFNFSK